MTSERIKEIQATTGYPDSVSIKQALLQVWNECEQSHPSPMSAEQVEELGEKYADSKYDKAIHLIGWSNTKHGFIAGHNTATTPSVKAEGWVSVEDGLPEIPPPYYDKDNEVHKPIQVEVWCFDGSEVYEDWFYFNSKPVGCTHWKYKEAIPSPPKQK